jgi:DNA-binding transcriptional regulator YhcF (GntR family)
MIRHLLHVNFDGQRGLQEQVRESLINAILSGIFPADTPLPSCRQLAGQLNVSRNTTALVFESLVNEGYLVSRPRSGYYLHPDYYHAAKTCRKLHLNAKALHHDGATACKSRPASRSRSSNRLAGCTIATRLFTASRIPNSSPRHLARGGKLAARRRARPGLGYRSYRSGCAHAG